VRRAENDAVEATAPVPTPAGVRRFAFRNLEMVSRSQARVASKLESLLSSAAATEELSEVVTNRLRTLFERSTKLRVDAVRVIRPGELRRLVERPTLLAAIALRPLRPRAFIEVDLPLAHAAVEILLGGAGGAVPLRPLTDIDEGIISFVLLEVLRALAPSIEPRLPPLRLEGVAPNVDPWIGQLGEESHVVIIPIRCTVGAHDGLVRIAVPASLLEMATSSAADEEARERRQSRLARHGGRIASVETWLRAEIGSVVIGARDLTGLGSGDVVLLDELSVRCDRAQGGSAELRVGFGQAGCFGAEVVLEGSSYRATITSFRAGGLSEATSARDGRAVSREAGRVAEAADGERTHPDERVGGEGEGMTSPSRDGAELLSDIPMQLAVELGRVPMTAEQVLRLHLGQVVELNRGPGEPVDLSVNGKWIARGELVEVEGQLGVRIVSIG
jgi:type III secretion system YscQ/HrcQ family protein